MRKRMPAIWGAALGALAFAAGAGSPAKSEIITIRDPAARKAARATLSENADVLKGGGSQGADSLKISGIGKDDVYGAWVRNIPVAPGEHYALSLFSRVTADFPKPAEPILMVFFYKDAAKGERAGVKYVKLRKTREWRHTYERMAIPKGTTTVAIGFRLSGLVAPSEAVECANVEFERIADPYKGVPLIDFEGWEKTPRRDVTIVPTEARVRTTTVGTGEAHSGEWYLEIEGANRSTQYSFYLKDVWVRPRTRYKLSIHARMTANVAPQTFIVMMMQYDAKGRSVGKIPYWYPCPYGKRPDSWTGAENDVLTHEDARTLTVLFRLEHVLPGNKVYLDDVVFTPTEPAVLLDWEIDPTKAVLSGTATPTGDIADQVERLTVSIMRGDRVVRHTSKTADSQSSSFGG